MNELLNTTQMTMSSLEIVDIAEFDDVQNIQTK